MDPEVARLHAHMDQTRAEMRALVRGQESDDLADLVKRCAAGKLADLDEGEALLVGMLAVTAIFDLAERGPDEAADAAPDRTPECGAAGGTEAPATGGPAAEARALNHGELTDIVIGTVVASGEAGINARELAGKLQSWGIPKTQHQAAVLLVGLAAAGRIERIACGRYRGV